MKFKLKLFYCEYHQDFFLKTVNHCYVRFCSIKHKDKLLCNCETISFIDCNVDENGETTFKICNDRYFNTIFLHNELSYKIIEGKILEMINIISKTKCKEIPEH